MGSFFSALAAGAGFCICSAGASLLTACCGNDKASSVPPGKHSGRLRSVFLLFLSIIIALIFQYAVAPHLQMDGTEYLRLINFVQHLVDAWTDGCDDLATQDLQERCSGYNGVYRASFCGTLFFLLAAVAAKLKPTANREAWPAKFVLFVVMTFVTIFIPNDPLFWDIYRHIALIGGTIFIIFQQIILIDIAYNWNDSWVEKSNAADAEEPGSGKKWLAAILISCAMLLIGSIVVIGLLYHFFSGCGINMAFVSITLIAGLLVTGVQLVSGESSLLTAATIFAYATYLCFTAVSKNPDEDCNPRIGEKDNLGIVLGLCMAMMSLAWTGFSWTAHEKIGNGSKSEPLVEENSDPQETADGTRKVGGVVINDGYGSTGDNNNNNNNNAAASGNDDNSEAQAQQVSSVPEDDDFSNSWKLNIVLALVSCWSAMALTGWGSIETHGDISDPQVSRVSMWMIIAAQWTALSLFLWTLVAPRVFPDRDFS